MAFHELSPAESGLTMKYHAGTWACAALLKLTPFSGGDVQLPQIIHGLAHTAKQAKPSLTHMDPYAWMVPASRREDAHYALTGVTVLLHSRQAATRMCDSLSGAAPSLGL